MFFSVNKRPFYAAYSALVWTLLNPSEKLFFDCEKQNYSQNGAS